MADPSENTPLLTRDDLLPGHDETQNHHSKISPEKSRLKLAITSLRILISLLSFSIFGILLAAHVLLTNGWPFDCMANSEQAVRIFTIVVLVNLVLSSLTVLLHPPSIFNVPLNITMSISLLTFADHLIGKGWPDGGTEKYNPVFCQAQWRAPADGGPWTDPNCEYARDLIKILIGVSAGLGILTTLFLVAVLLLELTALGKGEKKIRLEGAPIGAANTLLNGDEA